MKEKTLAEVKIYQRLISEVRKAESEILLVSNWFADGRLSEILLQKQLEGVKVVLVLEDYININELKFTDLLNAGGEIYRIGKKDFGLMHKRYCIVDEETAIFTLANWYPYVLVQNHESLIVTGHLKTIQNFKEHFNLIKSKATRLTGKKTFKSIITGVKKWLLRHYKTIAKSLRNPKKMDAANRKKQNKKSGFKMVKPSSLLGKGAKSSFFHRN
jgi:phosphatidylserine/phosphatidylglycerophosphate/cardiolipin synthase-like enzyme